jgi:hypothetical protein
MLLLLQTLERGQATPAINSDHVPTPANGVAIELTAAEYLHTIATSAALRILAGVATWTLGECEAELLPPPLTAPKLVDARRKVVANLQKTNFGLDPILLECLKVGVAYHHAGLTTEEVFIQINKNC